MKTGRNVGKVLGELETEVMGVVWKAGKPLSVSDVVKVLSKKRNIAYTTIMTIMGRLVDKGVLTRKLDGKNYLYQPKVSREIFVAKSVHNIFTTAVSTLGQEVVLHFTKEIQKINPKKREELLKMLDKKHNA